jgi:iron complex outermembrane receptor protein
MFFTMKKVFLTLTLAAASLWAQSQDTVQLSEAVIVGTRASAITPVAQTVVGKSAIHQADVNADVPCILNFSPSVVTSSESGLGLGNTTFRVRGSDPTRTNVTIDGVPLNDAESQAVFWVNMPDFASSLNSVQIQRGVGSSTNGAAAFGATVNMQTLAPSATPYAEISTSAGMYRTFRHNLSVGTGEVGKGFNFAARYSTVRSDGYIERSAARHSSFHGVASWQGASSFVKFSLLHGEEHTGLSWNGVPGYAIDSVKYPYFEAGVPGYRPSGVNRRYNPMGEYTDNSGVVRHYDNTDNYRQTHYHLHGVHRFSEQWNTHATLHFTRGVGYYEDYKLNRKLAEYGLPEIVTDGGATIKRSDLVRQKWMDNDFYGFTFAANYATAQLQWTVGGAANRHDGAHFGKVLWTRYNSGADVGNEWYRNRGVKNDCNLYTKINWQAWRRVNVYGDLQYRHIGYELSGADDDLAALDQSHSFNFFNPKFGAFVNIDGRSNAFVSFGVANREPTRADFKDASKYGSTDVPKPERLYDAELGYAFNSSRVSFGVNLYYMLYRDQLVSTGRLSSTGYAVMDNVPDSYRAGIELTGSLRIVKSLRLEANLTMSRNRIRNFVAYTDQYDGDWNSLPQKVENLGETSISFSPDIVGSARLRYSPRNNFSLLFSGKYVGKQFYDNTSSDARSLDAYFVSDFRVEYSFTLLGAKIGLQGLINNIFDKQYITSAWVYRAVFSNGSPDYIENGFFPQAGRNVALKLTFAIR